MYTFHTFLQVFSYPVVNFWLKKFLLFSVLVCCVLNLLKQKRNFHFSLCQWRHFICLSINLYIFINDILGSELVSYKNHLFLSLLYSLPYSKLNTLHYFFFSKLFAHRFFLILVFIFRIKQINFLHKILIFFIISVVIYCFVYHLIFKRDFSILSILIKICN